MTTAISTKNRRASQSLGPQALCEALLRADSEQAVIELLKESGWWDNAAAWRYYGDKPGNYSQIGNQQARPEAALVEKLTNAIDARLMGECQARGISPDSPAAPRSMSEAVSRFFGDGRKGTGASTIAVWDRKKRLEIARGITIAVTGAKQRPCITIADVGEGQLPSRVPETFMSLDQQNKVRVHFVQGMFNMGGTGVLRFCGKQSLQLLITKRDPRIVRAMREQDPDADYWSFTVVRREETDGKTSVFTYLAPVGADKQPRHGEVLRFRASSLALMPDENDPYCREVGHGSVLKLYEYDTKGFGSHALRKDGMLSRLETMLPSPALPIRIHECRNYGGHKGSFASNLVGLSVRLDENKAENLEPGFPTSVQFSVNGERMTAKIYAFKPDRAGAYIGSEGVIFSINGQTHGTMPRTLFARSSVKMGRLASSLLVTIDCSAFSQRAREDLFLASRDRLQNGELRKALEDQLEELLANHQGLRDLRNRRQHEELEERLKDDQPLEEVLAGLLKSSPSLATLFTQGTRLTRIFKGQGGKNGEPLNTGSGHHAFKGKKHPSVFKFPKLPYGHTLERHFEVGRKCRLVLETDAANDYFEREENPGRLYVGYPDESPHKEPNWNVTLHEGTALLSLDFDEDIVPGEVLTIQVTVEDATLASPFVNTARLTARALVPREGGGKTGRRGKAGSKGDEGLPGGLALPRIVPVREPEWGKYHFDAYSACTVQEDVEEKDGRDETSLTFYVNVDNAFLVQEQRSSHEDPRLQRAKFVFGTVLLGLGFAHRYHQLEKQQRRADSHRNSDSPARHLTEMGLPAFVSEATRAAAPFIVPMISQLSSLSDDEVNALASVGDEI